MDPTMTARDQIYEDILANMCQLISVFKHATGRPSVRQPDFLTIRPHKARCPIVSTLANDQLSNKVDWTSGCVMLNLQTSA